MFWNSVSFNSAEVSDLAVVSLLLELSYEKQPLYTAFLSIAIYI